jgi:subtilisin family serine protease
MDAMGVADIPWRGRNIYVKRNEWVVDLIGDADDPVDAESTLNAAGLGPIFRRTLGRPDMALIEVPEGMPQARLDGALRASRMLQSLSPNGIVWPSATPNDSSYASQQWGLNNTGQNNGVPDADIDAPEAWDLTTGGTSVVVGVIDTGVDYLHPDLYKNIWINQGEIPAAEKAAMTDVDGDGLYTFWDLNDPLNSGVVPELTTDTNTYIDGGDVLAHWSDNSTTSDGNSYTDDLLGWDFSGTLSDQEPKDDPRTDVLDGHGTHVAGIIGAMGNNSTGVTGVAWKTQLMAIRLFNTEDNQTSGTEADIIECVNYATWFKSQNKANVRVLNGSFEGGGDSSGVKAAIDNAGSAGILYVASAGNGYLGVGQDNDTVTEASPVYPASFTSANIVSVAATDRNDLRAAFSNYGLLSVDLAAPGYEVYSTKRNGTYGLMNGTSQAAPHVAGTAALAFVRNPNATYAEVKEALLAGADFNGAMYRRSVSSGRLNAFNTLSLIRAPLAPINGTSGNDTITVQMSGSDVTVTFGSTTNYGAASGISWIRINGLGGSDNISVTSAVTIPVHIDGGDGTDTLAGGGGNDRLVNGEGTISGNSGNDWIAAGSGNNTLNGGAGNDTLLGGAGDDALNGDGDHDTLVGEEDDDDLTGGAGNDSYAFPSTPDIFLNVDVIFEDASTATGGVDAIDLRGLTIGYGLNLFLWEAGNRGGGDYAIAPDSFETVAIKINHSNLSTDDNTAVENAFGAQVDEGIEGNSAANTLWGLGGPDRLEGRDGNDTLNGGDGNDNGNHGLSGGNGNDVLNGDAGNDRLDDGAGNDTINGGDGDDTLVGTSAANGADVFNGGAGSDTADYSARTANLSVKIDQIANDGLVDVNSDPEVTQSEADNIKMDVEKVTAGSGADTVTGGTTAGVEFHGGDGNDTLQGAAGNDILNGGSGADNIKGGSGNDTISGGAGNDTLYGDDPAFPANGGNDAITGNDGNDICYGGPGDDVITGGDGIDNMFGETGSDDFSSPEDGSSDFIDGGTGAGTDEILGIIDEDDSVINVP